MIAGKDGGEAEGIDETNYPSAYIFENIFKYVEGYHFYGDLNG